MIQLTKRLVMTADKHCYIVGEPRKARGRAIEIREPKYYSTAAQAVQGALATAMRMAVEDEEVTTLRAFIQEQERQRAALEKLIMPLEGGTPGENVVEAHVAAQTGKDTSQPPDGDNPAELLEEAHT